MPIFRPVMLLVSLGLIRPVMVILKDQDFSLPLAFQIPDGAKHLAGGWDLRSELSAASLERLV